MIKNKIFPILAFLLIVVSVSAQPPPTSIPNAFYGTVLIEGVNAPSGTAVAAKIDGEQRGNITTQIPGEYGTLGPFDVTRLLVSGTSADEGKTIEFFVNDQKADQTALWFSGNVTQLNLTVPAPTQPEPTQQQPSGGGSSGGGGSPTCTENWSCGDWSMCVNGEQVRTCSDSRSCGTTKNKPAEKQSCVPELPKMCTTGQLACLGDNVMECTDNDWLVVESCEFGCSTGRCLTEQEEMAEAQNPAQNQLDGITGLFLNPANLYMAFLVVIVILGGIVFLKFR